jgi:hypothetical protein
MKELALGQVAEDLSDIGEKAAAKFGVFNDVLGRRAEADDESAIHGDQSVVHG